jgi:hypothetical protein
VGIVRNRVRCGMSARDRPRKSFPCCDADEELKREETVAHNNNEYLKSILVG